MAKKCTTCKRSYPDHLSACPHCHPAKAGPAAQPFDEPIELGEDVHQAETQRPPRKKLTDEDILEIAAADELAKAAQGASDVLNVEEVEVVKESPSGKSDVLALDEAAIVAEPASSKSGVIDLTDAEVVAEPASAKSDVLEIAEAEAVAEPAGPKSDVLDLDAAQFLMGPSSGKSDVIPLDDSAVVTEPASAKSDVLEIAEAEVVPEPEAPKSDVLDLDAAQILMESPSGKSDAVAVDEAAVVAEPASSKSGILEIAEAEAVAEPASSKSDVLDLTAADVVVEPSSIKSGVLEIAEAEAVVEPASGTSDVLDIEQVKAVAETPSGKAAPAGKKVEKAEPRKPLEPPAPPAKQDPKATRIAGRAPPPTMLASEDLGVEGPGSELGGLLGVAAAAAAAPPPAHPRQEPPKKQDPKATRIAGKAPAPTMLAGDDILDEGPGSELRGPAVPPGLPKMELDSSKHDKTEEVVEVPPDQVVDDLVEEVSEDDLVDAADALEPDDELDETLTVEPPTGDSVKVGTGLDSLGDILVEGASEVVDFGAKPGSKGASGVDMIAEALESGVNLGGDSAKSPPPAQSPRGRRKSEVDLEGVFDELPESSAVDLGAGSPAKKKKETEADGVDDVEEVVDEDALAVPESSGEGSAEEALLAEGYALKKKQAEEAAAEVFGEDAVEVTGEDAGDLPQVKQKKGTKPDEIMVGEEGEVAEEVTEEAVDEELVVPKAKGKGVAGTKAKFRGGDDDLFPEEDDRKRGRRDKPERVRGGGRVLIGTFLGILLTAGAAVAIWYLAPDLLGHIPESPRLEGVKWQKAPSKKEQAQQAKDLAVLEARLQMDNGNFEKALALKGASKEQITRGDALWRKYVAARRGNDPPLPLSGDAEPVKEAKKELEDAKNSFLQEQMAKSLEADKKAHDAEKMALEAEAVRKAFAQFKIPLPKDKSIGEAVAEELGKKKEADALVKIVREELKVNEKDELTDKGLKTRLAAMQSARESLDQVKMKLKDDKIKTDAEVPGKVETVVTKLEDINDTVQNAKRKGTPDDAKPFARDKAGVDELVANRNDLFTKKEALKTGVASAMAKLREDSAVKKSLADWSMDPKVQPEDKKDETKQLAVAVQTLLEKAVSPLNFAVAAARANLAAILRALLDPPDQRLDNWIALARDDRYRADPENLKTLEGYLRWADEREGRVSPATRAKAEYARGLLLRNAQQFKEARESLQNAVKGGQATAPPPAWVKQAEEARDELINPTTHFLPTARKLQDAGHLEKALQELEIGLRALPDDLRLLVTRDALLLEKAKLELGNKNQPPKELVVAEVSKHAQAAQQAPNAALAREGYHLEGLLEEYKGNSTAAAKKYKEGIDRYKKAIELHKGPEDERARWAEELSRWIVDWDRATRQPSSPAVGADARKPNPLLPGITRLDKRPPESAPLDTPDLQVVSVQRARLVALLITGVMAEVDDVDETPQEKAEIYARATPEQKARLDEADALLELAKKLPAAKQGKLLGRAHIMKGRVYIEQAKNGEDTGTRGLKYYVQGLAEYYPGDETRDLRGLLEDIPELREAASTQNPRLADEYFGKGLAFFGACSFEEAEKQFLLATKTYKKDARYYYFLGMARYRQETKEKRQEAIRAWRQGADEEVANRPNSVYVNESLERVQGELRQLLNSYRRKTP